MPKEKKNKSNIPRMITAEELVARYIRQIVREEVEKYFERQVPDFE